MKVPKRLEIRTISLRSVVVKTKKKVMRGNGIFSKTSGNEFE